MKIERATLDDQIEILALEQTIFNDMDLDVYDILSQGDVQKAWQKAVAQSAKSRYHYSRALVAKDDNSQIMGVAFGYPDNEELDLDNAIQAVLADEYSYHRWLFEDSEVFDNEWYLDSIVVSENARGKGIGKQLLLASEKRALNENKKTIGLNVDDHNPKAKKLYESMGYQAVGRIQIGKHNYTHMQKSI